MKKLTRKEKKERTEKLKKFGEGMHKASYWIYHAISITLSIISYCMLPAFYDALNSNSWAILAGIVLIPLAMVFGFASLLIAFIDLIRSGISKKWWHIVIAAIEVLINVITILTTFQIIPSII